MIRFFPQQAVIASRIMVVLLWMFGSYVAIYGGFVPGLTFEPHTIYPWLGVIREVSIMTAESLCLYLILCFRKRGPSNSRLLAVTTMFAILAVWDRPPTDMPGYMYANSNFVIVAFFTLFFGLSLNLLRSVVGFAGRQRTA